MKKILIVFGTRPEAIKMAPVVKALKELRSDFEVKVCSTGQHREMLDQVMNIFRIKPDFELNVMAPNQTLADVTCKVLKGMEEVFLQWKPHLLLVQGDTTTVMAASLAAFYHKIEVGHVEAGLRTGNRYSPWPEEMNRLLAGRLATLHFAPTERAGNNLLAENIPAESVFVTGNTVIDALFEALKIIDSDSALTGEMQRKFSFLDPSRRLILVTGHRRENFGEGFLQICKAISTLAGRKDVQIVYPMHMNPNVRRPVNEFLGKLDNVFLIEPLDYLTFLYLMRLSYLILTDSGGVQEEAPSLGKPIVVMRDTTERPEAVAGGNAILAGANAEHIISAALKLLDDPEHYTRMSSAKNPYGNGDSARQIADILQNYFRA